MGHGKGEGRGQAAADRRGAVRRLPGRDRGGAGPRQPGRGGPGLLHRAAAAGRAQEHRADGGAPRPGAGAGHAPSPAPCRRPGRVGRRVPAAGRARAGVAGDRAARPGALLDRGRHRLPEAGQALGRRRPAVLRRAGQAGQLSGGGEPVGGQRPGQPAGRLAALPARGLGRGPGAAGQGRRAGGDRVCDQAGDRPRADPPGAGRGRAGGRGAGRCRLRRATRPTSGSACTTSVCATCWASARGPASGRPGRRRCRPSPGPVEAGRRPGFDAVRSTGRSRSRIWPWACRRERGER